MIYKPSTTTSILLLPKLDHGMLILRQPSLEYFILKGKFNFLIASAFSRTFWMDT